MSSFLFHFCSTSSSISLTLSLCLSNKFKQNYDARYISKRKKISALIHYRPLIMKHYRIFTPDFESIPSVFLRTGSIKRTIYGMLAYFLLSTGRRDKGERALLSAPGGARGGSGWWIAPYSHVFMVALKALIGKPPFFLYTFKAATQYLLALLQKFFKACMDFFFVSMVNARS